MKKDTGYHDFIVYDLLASVPAVSSRPMMGGWCIYSEGVPFAAIIGNELYLKAKGPQAALLQGKGWQQFSYAKKDDKRISMSYWRVPEALIDEPQELTGLIRELLFS